MDETAHGTSAPSRRALSEQKYTQGEDPLPPAIELVAPGLAGRECDDGLGLEKPRAKVPFVERAPEDRLVDALELGQREMGGHDPERGAERRGVELLLKTQTRRFDDARIVERELHFAG